MHHSKVTFKSMISADDTGQIDLQAWMKKLSGTWMRCPLQSTLSAKASTLEGDLPYLFRKEVTVTIGVYNPYVAGGWFCHYKMMPIKNWKMIETLAPGYSYESTQRELSNEYQHDRV